MSFHISKIQVGGGVLGICPIPGRFGTYHADMTVVRDWSAQLVLSLTEAKEFSTAGAQGFQADLAAAGILWKHIPIEDFATPSAQALRDWSDISHQVVTVLHAGGHVLVHCFGGCGRSGMIALRMMVALGEDPQTAFRRLRAARPCAVETVAQLSWATEGVLSDFDAC